MHFFTSNEWIYEIFFQNGSKNMSFLIKNDEVWDKYYKIWGVIKNKLNIKIHREPVYEYKCLTAKVREFNCVIKTNFLNNDMPNKYALFLHCLHNY